MGYFIVAQLSSIIRMFIENPLEPLILYDNLTVERLLNLLFILRYWPMIMHVLTFGIVGGIYKRGECAILGSALYLFTFWINSNILKFLVSIIGAYGIAAVVIPFLVICLFEFIGMNKLRVNIVEELVI